jgi:hypothetical protein
LDDVALALGGPCSVLVRGNEWEALQGLIAGCRYVIGGACGASPEKVRIFVEL